MSLVFTARSEYGSTCQRVRSLRALLPASEAPETIVILKDQT